MSVTKSSPSKELIRLSGTLESYGLNSTGDTSADATEYGYGGIHCNATTAPGTDGGVDVGGIGPGVVRGSPLVNVVRGSEDTDMLPVPSGTWVPGSGING